MHRKDLCQHLQSCIPQTDILDSLPSALLPNVKEPNFAALPYVYALGLGFQNLQCSAVPG
jgi:hypothetical protein